MLEEGPSMQAVIGRPDKGPMQRFLQKIGEPRVLAWIAVAAVLILWEIVVAAAQLNPIYLPRPTQILIALAAMFSSGGLSYRSSGNAGTDFRGFCHFAHRRDVARHLDGDFRAGERDRG